MKKNKLISEPKWIAAISAMLSGLLIHLFGLVTVLQNYDNIAVTPAGYGTGISSGRWFLTVLGELVRKNVGGYNLPWFNGIIGLFLLAVSVWILIDLFQIQSRKFAVLLGMGFIAFPSVTSCMLFKYTIVYYMFAVLLSVLAAYVAIRAQKEFLLPAAIVSGIMTACSLGIYQAYLPVTAAIMVLFLLQQVVAGKKNWKKILLRGIYLLICLVIGLILYSFFLHRALEYYGVELSSYQGIDSMGNLGILEIIRLIVDAFKGYFLMPQENTYMLAPIPIMMVVYHFWNIGAAVIIVVSLFRSKAGVMTWIVAGVLCICFPIAVNLLVVMCPNAWIYTLMVHAFTILQFIPVVIFEAMPKEECKRLTLKRIGVATITLSLCMEIFSYSYIANTTYTAEYYSNRKMENLANALVIQMRMTEGYKPTQSCAIIGHFSDPTFADYWSDVIACQGSADTKYLISSYSRSSWLHNYIGVNVQEATPQVVEKLAGMEIVQNMPCWPAYGSMRVINDVLVLKLSD